MVHVKMWLQNVFLIQLYGYKEYNQICPLNPDTSTCYGGNIFMLIVNGILVNGPYCLITTSVSADLGTHPSLQGTQNINNITPIILY